MINFRLMKQLWMFVAVAEEQHFGRAAQRLGMSQPPLTEQIKVLEQALRLTLFERSRQGTRLTPEGAAILPAVQKFVEQMGQLERAVSEAAQGQTGVLTIGAVSAAMFDAVPPIVDMLKKRMPGLAISVREIDSVDALPALERGDIDLAFARLDGLAGDTIATLPLEESRLCVALHHQHPLAQTARIRLDTLNEEEFVMFERRYSPLYFDSLMASCRSHGFSPRMLHEVRSITSQIAFVGCGQGVALVPATMKKMAPQSVVFRPLKEKIMVTTAAVSWNRSRPGMLVDAAIALISGKHAG
jgi:DNA-binding transcriptional LysR family regulator